MNPQPSSRIKVDILPRQTLNETDKYTGVCQLSPENHQPRSDVPTAESNIQVDLAGVSDSLTEKPVITAAGQPVTKLVVSGPNLSFTVMPTSVDSIIASDDKSGKF